LELTGAADAARFRLYPNGFPVASGSSVTTSSTAPKSVLVQEPTIPVAKKMSTLVKSDTDTPANTTGTLSLSYLT
jgi:hypothetical protein